MASSDTLFQKGLPADLDSERLVLGAILMNESAFIDVAASLEKDDFSVESHRRIFERMLDLSTRGEKIDRVTLANELRRFGQLEAVGGVSYLLSLDDGMPQISNLDSYVGIVKDKSILRRIIFASQGLIDRALIGQDHPNELLQSAEKDLLQLGDSRTSQSLITTGQVIENYEGGLNAFLDPSRRVKGTSSGFLKFDNMTGGMHEGELIILAARPSMGKTALALNIGQYVATHPTDPRAVAIFSLEMSNDSLLTRMICAAARVDQIKFRTGFMQAEDRRKLQVATSQLVQAPLFVDDTSDVTLMDIRAKLRRMQTEHPLGLVIIDYLQLMSGKGKQENRNQEVSQISRGLKLLAKDLKVPFLVLSQLSRATETRVGDHRPQLSDLRESGSIEQDADLVLFIFRPEVYQRDREDLRGEAELIIAKQRNGPIGKVKLVFLHEFTKFENRMDDIDGDDGGE